MQSICWTEDFSVGVPEMDKQHKKLVAMINRLIEDPKVATGSETISDLLTEMIKYAQEHFRDEEALLTRHGFPFLDRQVQQHKSFVKKTVDFCSAVEIGVDIVPQVMQEYLKEWLVRHILEQDMAYKKIFLDRRLS